MFGTAPDDRPIESTGIAIWEVRDGKLAHTGWSAALTSFLNVCSACGKVGAKLARELGAQAYECVSEAIP